MPIFTDRDEMKIELTSKGYSNIIDDKSNKKTIIIQLDRGGDRVGALVDAANKLKSYGAKYNDKGGQSSIGRTELSGGFRILCKIKGGGGSGAGSDLTAIVESAQCIFLSAKYNKNGRYDKTSLSNASSNFDVTDGVSKVMSKLNEDWIDSSIKGAEFLSKKYPNSGKNYVCHRGSRWVSKLENHWKKLNDEAGKPFSNLNKWSPADIWMISTAGNLIDITSTKTLLELNELLLKNYTTKDIIGVSLKKIETNVPRFKELNITNVRKKYDFSSSTTGLRDYFSSGDGYIYFKQGNQGKIQFRKFGSTWQGEIKGQTANMGKISGGPIINIVKDVFNVDMTPQRDIKQRTEADEDKLYEWYSAIPYHENMDKSDFIVKSKEKDQNWFVSKIMTTQLISIVENATTQEKNKFITNMLNYAASESELSGPFCKIY